MAAALKHAGILVICLLALVPACGLLGYGIGYAISIFVHSATLRPDSYELDRELFAGIYGIMFIGGGLYVLSAAYLLFRFFRALRRG